MSEAQTTPTSTRPGREWTVMLAVLFATLLVPLNSTMISIALPEIAADLEVGTGTVNWLVTVYLIGIAALQPVAGKIGDRLGRRPVLLTGLVLFGVASVAAGFASGLTWLIVCRAAQAVAGALLMPTTMAVIRDAVPAERLGRFMGVLGAIVPIATAVGPPMGGFLLSTIGWQAVFLVNVPVVLVAIVLGRIALPPPAADGPSKGFDVLGSVLLCALLIGVTLLFEHTLGGIALAAGCAALVALFAVFLRHEMRRADPVLQPRLFANRGFAVAGIGVLLSNFSFYIALLAVPMLLYGWEGVSSAQSGLILMALTVGASPLSIVGGRLVDRVGPRLPAVLGFALMATGLLVMAVSVDTLTVVSLVVILACIGAGVGLSMPAFQLVATTSVDAADTGSAMGVFSTVRYLGSIVGTSLLAGPLAVDAVGGGGFAVLFGVLAAVSMLGIATSFAFPARRVSAD